MKNIDIFSIRSKISKIHKKEMFKFGNNIEKVLADHQWNLESVFARIKYILEAFKEEKIIDVINIENCGSCYKLDVSKKNIFSSYVSIITDGEIIVVKGKSYIEDNIFSDKMVIREAYTEEFDWENFSIDLLHFIHNFIYLKKKAHEAKIFG